MKRLLVISVILFSCCFAWFFLRVSPAAALGIDSVYPSLGQVDAPLDVSVRGNGFTTNTRASISLDALNRMQVVGNGGLLPVGADPTAFAVSDIAVSGDTAYVLLNNIPFPFTPPDMYLLRMDIRDPTNPVLIDQTSFGNDLDLSSCSGTAIAVSGGYAYLSVGMCGLMIVDTSGLGAPKFVNLVGTGGFAVDVDLMGQYALVAQDYSMDGSADGLVVVDVGNPSSAKPLSFSQVKGCRKVSAGQGVAYVLEEFFEGQFGLRVIDLGDPTAPVIKGAVATGDIPVGFESFGTTVYMTGTGYGLRVIDAADEMAPAVLTRFDVSGDSSHLEIDPARKVAFVGADSSLLMVDISVPASPYLLGEVALPLQYSDLRGIAVSGDLVVAVEDSTKKMYVVDSSAPVPLTVFGEVFVEGRVLDVRVVGGNAYVTVSYDSDRQAGSLLSYDISDPARPRFKKRVDFGVGPNDTVISGNTMYIIGDRTLLLIDLGSMASPVQVPLTFAFSDDTARALDVAGDKAYIATAREYLAVVDLVPGPNYLKQLSPLYQQTPDSATTSSIRVRNNVAYIIKYSQDVVVGQLVYTGYLRTIDVSNPASPAPLGVTSTELMSPTDLLVSGTTAYIADELNGLVAMDVSNPSNPGYVGKWLAPGSVATGICGIDNNSLFILSRPGGVLKFDLPESPSTPQLVGSAGVRGWPAAGAVYGGYGYVASGTKLTVVPLPVELPVRYVSPTMLDVGPLPLPPVEGNYTIRVFDSNQSSRLTGGVTYTGRRELLSSRAIVVAGGGNYPGNQILAETRAYANYAYDNLIYQGYRHEDIYYLTDEPDALARYGGLAASANLKPATLANLKNAILNWAVQSGTSDLLLFMEDHGDTEEFVMRGGATPEMLSADELDSWLDSLQTALPGGKIILIYDACRSGSFISRLTPPAGKIRLLMTSSSPDQTAYFLSDKHSFSAHFWSTFTGKAGDKAILTDGFARAAANMAPYQAAQLDANGNGVPNEPGDFTALEGYEGTIYALRRQFNDRDRSKPVIPIVAPDQIITGPNAQLRAEGVYDLDGDAITRVWAEIYGPDFDRDTDNVTVRGSDLPACTLPSAGSGAYQQLCSGFSVNGTSIITYYAEDASGIYSLPVTALVTRTGGSTVLKPDEFENDDSRETARVIIPNSPTAQNHSFHVSGDQDWVMFYGLAGQVYNIRAMNPTLISDPVITLYNDSSIVFGPKNTAGVGEEEAVIGWICPADAIYYVRLTNNSPYGGANVRYKLKVYNPIALSLPGYITGRIMSGGVGVGGVIVRAGGGTAITLADGTFILYLAPGSYTVSVSGGGVQAATFPVAVSSGGHTSKTVQVNLLPRIATTPPAVATVNKVYDYTPVVIDQAGDSHVFSISGKPDWLTFSATDGRMGGVPGFADVGAHGPVTLTVTDSGGGSDSVVFSINVTKGQAGSLPSIMFLLLNK